MRATRSYLVCCTQRTGSTLLGAALRRTGIAGNPTEYFDPKFFSSKRFNSTALALPEQQAATPKPQGGLFTRLRESHDRVMDASVTDNGVFGAKVHWSQLGYLFRMLVARGVPGADAPEYSVRTLQAYFPDLRFIFLRRMNKVAQAISAFRARRSGVYALDRRTGDRGPDAGTDISYEFTDIDRQVAEFVQADEGWAGLLEPVADLTLALTYEELSADYEGAVHRVLRHLDLSPNKPIAPPSLRKQADTVSLEWERRYRQQVNDRRAGEIGRAAAPDIGIEYLHGADRQDVHKS